MHSAYGDSGKAFDAAIEVSKLQSTCVDLNEKLDRINGSILSLPCHDWSQGVPVLPVT